MVTICSIGIFAIQIKKLIEYKKDEKISIEGFLQSQPPVVPVNDVVDLDNIQPVSKFSKNYYKKIWLSAVCLELFCLLLYLGKVLQQSKMEQTTHESPFLPHFINVFLHSVYNFTNFEGKS